MNALLVLVVPLLALLAFAVAVALRPTHRVAAGEHDDVLALQRRGRVWRVVSLAAGLLVVIVVAQTGDSRSLAVAPTVFGVVLLLGTCLAELTARRPEAAVRSATTETRTVSRLLRPASTTVAATGVVLLAAALAVGTAMGSADDLGRAGRTLAVACRPNPGEVALARHGAWPGSYYAVPMGLALALAVLVAAVTVAAVVRRPRPSAESATLDGVLRTAAARYVLLALGLVAWASLAPVAVFMSAGFHGVSTATACAPGWYGVAVVVTVVTTLIAVAATSWCLGALLAGPRIVVEGEPAAVPAGPGASGRR